MKYAVDIPNFGYWADPRRVTRLAAALEDAGWDGLSVWDHLLVWNGNEVADPWVLLAAAATATERLTLMSMVTALPRRRPWKVAREAVSIDLLSGGRFVLGVGIGYPPGPEFRTFGEPTDARTRADMLDESLEIITGLWSGESFRFKGEHYRIDTVRFLPTPLQRPRIPIWVAGMWPNRRPFRRAARWDGVAPIVFREGVFEPMTPEVLSRIVDYVTAHRPEGGAFDVTVAASLPSSETERAGLRDLEEAGVTWWRAGWDPEGDEDFEDWLVRLEDGPPRP